jgi:hypothetical protein
MTLDAIAAALDMSMVDLLRGTRKPPGEKEKALGLPDHSLPATNSLTISRF